jgi:hypothetical protein
MVDQDLGFGDEPFDAGRRAGEAVIETFESRHELVRKICSNCVRSGLQRKKIGP